MAENVSNADGKKSLSRLFKRLGVAVEFEKISATSRLFIPGTEEILIASGLRLGRMGLASPIALSVYGLDVPVFLFEFSVSRLAMALGLGHTDKEIHYPQFFGKWEMSDAEIAELLKINRKPKGWGRELSAKIVKTCLLYSSQPAPCEFRVFEKEIGESNLEVWLVSEKDALCGKDFNNELIVHNGNIISSPAMPTTPLEKEALAGGVKTGITLLSAFADYAAALIEEAPTAQHDIKLLHPTAPTELNVLIPKLVEDYVKTKGTALDIGGDLGITVSSRAKRLWRHEQPR